MQQLLFGTFMDEETGLLVFPASMVAAMAEKRPNAGSFRAGAALERFGSNALAPRILPANRRRGRADWSLPACTRH
jgi:hypothetical protein